MRMTEFLDYITRTDLHLGRNAKPEEYTHLTITNRLKRARYVYQLERRKDERDKKRFTKDNRFHVERRV